MEDVLEKFSGRRYEFDAGDLGVLWVGYISIKVIMDLTEVSLIDPPIDDAELVKKLMCSICCFPAPTGSNEVQVLGQDDVKNIPVEILDRFAATLLESEDLFSNLAVEDKELPPVSALAKAFRREVEEITESSRKFVESFGSVVSPRTRKLFEENEVISAQLKRISGARPGFVGLSYPKNKNIDESYFSKKRSHDSLDVAASKNSVRECVSEFGNGADDLIGLSSLDLPVVPQAVTNDLICELRDKAEDVKSTVDLMGGMLASINDFAKSVVLDFKKKQLDDQAQQVKDEGHQRLSIYIAAGSLVFSLIVGIVGLIPSFASYNLAKKADLETGADKKALFEQLGKLKELTVEQKNENAALKLRVESLEKTLRRVQR